MTVWSWIDLAGWLPATILFARLLREVYPGMPKWAALLLGLLAGLGWVLWLPMVALYLCARHFLTTSHERHAAERAELERLRALAREYGLPL